MANRNLSQEKKAKNDEFYTQLTDIEKELAHYRKQNEIINKELSFLKKDGIHQISKEQWDIFRKSFGIWPSKFELQMDSFFVLCRDSYYMFFAGKKEKRYLFDSGLRTLATHELEYYYDNLLRFVVICENILTPRQKVIDYIASIIKQLGFDGLIHGCIIDVDFYSHIFVNPIDLSITPYRAKNVRDKIAYGNIFSFFNAAGYRELCLLSLRIKEQKKLLETGTNDTYDTQKYKMMIELYNAIHKLDTLISKGSSSFGNISVSDTRIYRLSKRVLLLQNLKRNHVLEFWDDSYFENSKNMIDKI